MRTQDQVAAMACPVCRVPLAMSDRQGIEIDYCPQCRGVWLDRGELDKIIERNAAEYGAPAQAAVPAPAPAPQAPPQQSYAPPPPAYPPQGYQQTGHHDPRYDPRYGHGYGGKPYKRKKSWLEEILD
jgi:uncharacterized protein